MHIYIEESNENAPLLVFLSGAGTAAPVYDFKPLYSLLLNEYRVAVVEKIGYGYSEIADVPRDIDTILSETRTALSLLGERGPYILLPHSMSGLEALRWTQLYPDEVKGIIGIDMAMPSVYEQINSPPLIMLKALAWMGVQRVSFVYPVSDLALMQDEYRQARLLTYRNAINKSMMNEGNEVYKNAQIVSDIGIPDVPMLLLVSDGIEIGEFWIQCQEEFARQSNARIEYFDCGHYIHQHEPEKVAALCREFIEHNIKSH